MSRDITKFKRPEIALEFQKRCEEAGHEVIFTSVDRDYKEQYAYYCQGRESLDITNKFRRLAGLSPIKQLENQRKVTWTLYSRHVVNLDDEKLDNDKSEAFDFAIIYDKKAVWDIKADIDGDNISDYIECIEIGEALGLISGRTFKNRDYVHMELPKENA